ncbi:MAG: aminodeoxychorismate synthase component I [Rudaea sp.]|nr:aminodeoxychorismate synthase component I [Rudaea sp.]
MRTLPGVRDLLPLAAAHPQRYPCLLESVRQGARSRYDALLAFPQEALTLGHDGHVRDTQGRDHGTRFIDALDAAWRAEGDRSCAVSRQASLPMREASMDLPFRGGWALFLGYELAAEIEPCLRLPAAPDPAIPVALALRCPAAIIVDRLQQRTVLVAERGRAELIDILQSDLAATPAFVPAPLMQAVIEEDPSQVFLDGVARIHDYLRGGDVFQVNLSREWRARYAQAPVPAALYAHLRHANPAPFAGMLQWNDWSIASSSPERLVEVRDGGATTRPIAGTRPRLAGDDDATHVRELVSHPKERAEHVMLIDLERNDLGRVCIPGSVVVDELMQVESYAHVHHIVSNVGGRLRSGVTPGQVIRAMFPGGTITGCPKVRTMQIIAELESVGRGAYTGALGYLNHDGSMDLNILIRTLAQCGADVRLRAGAGIVADSDAANELEETRAKARGMLRALRAKWTDSAGGHV